jgi:hypothetical protein
MPKSKDIEDNLSYVSCPPPPYSSITRHRLERDWARDDEEAGRLIRLPKIVAAIFVAFLLLSGFFAGVLFERIVR